MSAEMEEQRTQSPLQERAEEEPANGSSADLGRAFLPKDLEECNRRLRAHFDQAAPERDRWRRRNLGYYLELEKQYRLLVPEGARVLEVGCSTGHLLAALRPAVGLGVDFSGQALELARSLHAGNPRLSFEESAIRRWDPAGRTFDYIVLSDLLGYLYDIEAVFEHLRSACHPRTRLLMNFHSRLWQPFLKGAEWLGLKPRQPLLNWVTVEDISGMLSLCGYETIRSFQRVLLPKRLPPLSTLANRMLAPLRPFSWFALCNFVVARLPRPPLERPPRVSVICPCRNEAGNIPQIVRRLPHLGAGTELIFVEGNSTDETWQACLEAQQAHPEARIQCHRQTGKGKGDAVRLGFSKATGEVLMILDADLTVTPEDLPHFYEALAGGRVEFVNGSRLVYPMEAEAMRFLNLCANKFFGMAFTFLIGQQIKDTLCGTKALLKSDYEAIARNRAWFGELDPFGDFDLLFGAAKLGLKIQDLPIRYRDRTYGATNINRFRHGWLLLRMCWLALWRLKCP